MSTASATLNRVLDRLSDDDGLDLTILLLRAKGGFVELTHDEDGWLCVLGSPEVDGQRCQTWGRGTTRAKAFAVAMMDQKAGAP